MHLLVDSTGLRLCGAGKWLLEKHGTRTRRSWRKLHIGLDAGTGRIVAASLTAKEVGSMRTCGVCCWLGKFWAHGRKVSWWRSWCGG